MRNTMLRNQRQCPPDFNAPNPCQRQPWAKPPATNISLLVLTRRQLGDPVFKVCVFLVGAGTNFCVEIGQMNIRRSAYRHLSNPAPNAWPMTQHGPCGAIRIEIDPMGWNSPRPAPANSRVFGGITDKVRIQPLEHPERDDAHRS